MITRAFLAFTFGTVAMISSARADTYKVDPIHSTIIFRVTHFNLGHVYGRFDKFSGEINFDSADPSKGSVNLTVNTDSVDSNSGERDNHIKGGDFLNVKQFPTATFKSTSIKKVDDKNFEVAGDFTLRGITKPVTLNIAVIGSGKGPQGEARQGAEGILKFKRSDFDVKWGLQALSDEIQLLIALEGIKQ